MKKVDGVLYLSIGEVAKEIGRSTITIKNWIEWYEKQTQEIKEEYPLPEFRRDLDKRQSRYVEKSLVFLFRQFRDSMVYGKLSLFDKQTKLSEEAE